MSPKIFTVIKFELKKSLKSFSFWLLPILFAVFGIMSMFLPMLINSIMSSKPETNRLEILVIDEKKILDLQNPKNEKIAYTEAKENLEQIKEKMRENKIANLLLISDLNRQEFYKTPESEIDSRELTLDLNQRFLNYQLREGLIVAENKDNLLIEPIEPKVVFSQKDQKDFINLTGYVVGTILFTIILMFGSLFMNQIIVEKNSKVYEIILSSMDTKDLFIGKYIAFLLRALLQMIVGVAAFIIPTIILSPFLLLNNQDLYTSVPDKENEVQVATDFVGELVKVINLTNISVILIFSLLGIVLYSALMSLIGACYKDYMSASNSSMSFILTVPIVIPLFFNMYFTTNPNLPVSIFFQLFPLTSPIAITSFVFNDFSWVKVVLALVFLLFSIWLSFKVAIKIYLEGALADGNISLKEFWKIIWN